MARVPEVALRALSVGTRAMAPAQSSPEFITRKPEECGAGLYAPSEDIYHITRPLPSSPMAALLPLSGVRQAAHMWCEGVAPMAVC